MSTLGFTEAYCNLGRWIADCPRPDCNNAIRLEPKQSWFVCEGGCSLACGVLWPSDISRIVEVLEMRPVPGTRNWAPPGHRQAIACGVPNGQNVFDLLLENEQHGLGR